MRALEAGTRCGEVLARTAPRILALCAFLSAFFLCDHARAYPFMLRHGYTGCATCHLDPSGSGILTPYGRVVGELAMRSRYGEDPEEPGPGAEFLFGLVPLPAEVMLGGDARYIGMINKTEGAEISYNWFLMQADVEAGLHIGGFLASGSLGYAETGALGASITRSPDGNLVSRQHWLGYEIEPDLGLVARAGRMNVPFGIRSVEHTLWARSLTDTNINDDQQYGVALAFEPEPVRGEVMLLLGNYQLRPDEYRERGVSGFVEWSPVHGLGFGLSELSTHRELDQTFLLETWRHQFGAFGRWATPWQPLLVLGEADYVFRSPKQDERRQGIVSYLQLDFEPVQGFHVIGTGELQNVGIDGPPASYGLWVSEHWFFAPHADLRVDGIYQSLGSELGRTDVLTLLAQVHVYL
jgi:hypothetical protein